MTTQQQAANLKRAFAEHGIPWPKKRTIYFDPTGPLIQFMGGLLIIQDLNPEFNAEWRMSRKDMLMVGLRFIRESFRR